MIFKKNAGIAFPALMSLFMIILFFMSLGFLTNPLDNSISEFNFGDTTKEIDLIFSKIPSHSFYVQDVLERFIANSKNEFILSEEFKSCRDGTKAIWFDERNLKENCFPKIEDDMEDFFSKFLERELTKILDSFKDEKISSNLNLNYNEETKSYDIEIKNIYSYESRRSNLIYEDILKEKIDISSYFKLIDINLKIIDSLAEEIILEVPKCVKDNFKDIEDIEIHCIEKVSKDFFLKSGFDENFQKEYDMKIKFSNLKSDEKYFSLDFSFQNKNTNNIDLDFKMVLEDKIPFYYIDFDLSNSPLADNVLNIKIYEPKFSKQSINNYVVIYSYENFFDKNSFEKYDELLELLSNNQIPNDFTILTMKEGNFYYYSSDPSIPISILVTDKSGFMQDGERLIKNINLYSIYDYEEEKETILKNEEIFVHVFAVDKYYNYYIENFETREQSIIPEKISGPKPIVSRDGSDTRNLFINSAINGLESSLILEIKNYDDETFDYYDIYIRKANSNTNLVKACEGLNDCFYINGKNRLNSANTKIFLRGEDISDIEIKENFEIEIEIDSNIKNWGKLELSLIPIDKQGNTILNEQMIGSIVLEKDNKISLERVNRPLRVDPIEFEIADRRAPKLSGSYEILSLNTQDSSAYLQWKALEPEKLAALYMNIGVFNLEGELILQKEGAVPLMSGLMPISLIDTAHQIKLSQIIPMDTSSNSKGSYDKLSAEEKVIVDSQNTVCIKSSDGSWSCRISG